MDYFISVQSSAGVRYSEIHSVTSWTSNLEMDKSGTYSFQMPAADPQAALLQPKRVVVCYAVINGAVTEVGSGIIDQVDLALDANGSPTGALTVSGSDRLRELTYRNVGPLLVSDGGYTGPADIIAFAPTGWTLDVVNGYNATAKKVLQQYKSETVLDAFVKLTSITGEHFRTGVGQKVVWTKNDQPPSGVRAFYGIDPLASEGLPSGCIVTNIRQSTDSTDGYIGRVYALGSGTGTAQITLNGATCGYAGYALGSDSKGHYLEHTATWTAYGIETVRAWNDQLTAQSLMETAYEMQRRSLTPPQSYTLSVIGLTTALQPGSTIRLVAHQWIDGYHAINIDADLVILSVANRLDAQGLRTVGLTCSTIDRPVLDDTALAVSQFSAVNNSSFHSQPVAGADVVGAVASTFNDAEGYPAAVGTAAYGASVYASRRNHVHAATAASVGFAATDKLLGRATAGAGAGEEIALTAAGRALLDDADAAAQLVTLGALAVPGAWTTPAYAAGDFTASGSMTWTVQAGDVSTYAYAILGKIMIVSLYLVTTTIGGTPSNALIIKIPGSKTATKTTANPVYILDNGGGAAGYCYVTAGTTLIVCKRTDGANFTASTNLTSIFGQLVFEIN